jgi:phage pi2 protein 07
MAQPKKKSKTSETVRAWVATPADAKTISVNDLEVIEKKFMNLTVVRKKDGSIVIYPEHQGNRDAFDAFMEANGAFQQMPVQLNTL